jgi:hypothetical protein
MEALSVSATTDWMSWLIWSAQPYTFLPLTLSLVVAFTIVCELFPHWINGINSNVGTSQIQWNVGTPAYNYQLMNYVLYHRKNFAITAHGATFVLDGLLWMMYFHHLLQGVFAWEYCFVFFLALVQAFTFSDMFIRWYLFFVQVGYLAVNFAVTQFTDKYEFSFAAVSWVLLLNAIIRVASHLPEDLPIHFFNMNNNKPIPRWWLRCDVLTIIVSHPFRFTFAMFLAILSELQAGLPIRLVGCAWVMIYSKIVGGIATRNTNIDQLTDTADYIAENGFFEDQNAKIRPMPIKKEPIFKWMDTAPDRINFERMIQNEFPQPIQSDKLPQGAGDSVSTPVAGGDDAPVEWTKSKKKK